MRFHDGIFSQLLEPICRRSFRDAAERLGGEAYVKGFDSWQHLVALVFAQLAGAKSLRAIETGFNANAHHHYHLGVGRIARSTLGDANNRRPAAIFAEAFAKLSRQAGSVLKTQGAEMLRLVDSSPIPLTKLSDWATSNGRIRGLKLHVVYDPNTDHPLRTDITPATVNDISIGRRLEIETGACYVFDKGYCSYPWWSEIHAKRATFVTRPKSNARFTTLKDREVAKAKGDGFAITRDETVALASKGDSKLDMPLRRVSVTRDNGQELTLITNDLKRPAVEIAARYKIRWQIELLFRWLKQNLNLRTFLGRSENAVKLQVLAAMIAYLLLRIAARLSRQDIPAIRYAELIGSQLFTRRCIASPDRPPPVNPNRPAPRNSLNQLSLCYE